MIRRQFFIVLVFVSCCCQVNTRNATNCELARALTRAGVSKTWTSTFVCLAKGVSGLDTALSKKTSPKSYNYGIFQINATKYCGNNGRPGGECNMTCERLLDDNIMDDVRCAVQIEQQTGFKYWKLWEDRCKWNSRIVNWNLPNLINCGH